MASVSMPSASLPIPTQQSSAVAAEVSTPIDVTGARGLRAAEVRIQFDPAEVTTDASKIRSGSVWSGQAAIIAKVDQSAGTIVAFVFSANPVTTGEGQLIDIDFVAQSKARHDGPIEIDVQKVRLNEGRIALTNEPVVGHDSSDGRIETGTVAEDEKKTVRVTQTFFAPSIAALKDCEPCPVQPQRASSGENVLLRGSWQEVQGPLAPHAVDDVFEHLFDSSSTQKHDYNVRATWQGPIAAP